MREPATLSMFRLRVNFSRVEAGEARNAYIEAGEARNAYIEAGSEFGLEYELFDTPLTEHWLELLHADLNSPDRKIYRDGVFYGAPFFDEGRIRARLNDQLRLLAETGDHRFSEFADREYTLDHLARIHDLKEELTRLDAHAGFQAPPELRQKLLDLNFLIHELEFGQRLKSGDASVVIVPYPPSREKMSATELGEFTPDIEFGHLYLDYATNGVPFLDVFRDGSDMTPAPQEDVTSGFWLCFQRSRRFEKRQELASWLKTKFSRDISDPGLALGNIPLGRLCGADLASVAAELPRIVALRSVQIVVPQSARTIRETPGRLARAVEKLNAVSPSFCPIPWKHATINFATASSKSCCHHPFQKIDLKAGFAQLHDTEKSRVDRAAMLAGEKPDSCAYCWWLEEKHQTSDRQSWSSKSWMILATKQVGLAKTAEALNPAWLELNFSSACQFQCSYCSPIFSSRWRRDIEENGPYPTDPPHNDLRYLPGLPQDSDPEESELMSRFWPWFETVYPNLRLLKLTGGEPLLAGSTIRMLDFIASRPSPLLNVSLNTNLCCPESQWRTFLETIRRIESRGAGAGFHLQPSLDSWGKRAEYIRHGLDIDLFKRHLEEYLDVTQGDAYMICTLNCLSLGGLLEFWENLLSLKRRYAKPGRTISLTTEPLMAPSWQSLSVLPPDYGRYIETTIDFARKNQARPGEPGFEEFEVRGLERALGIVQSSSVSLERDTARKNFVRFFREYDRRHSLSFHEVFPELADLYSAWGEDRGEAGRET